MTISMVFLILMMTKIIFSQEIMEIYAYGYISQYNVEKSNREDTVRLKSRQNDIISKGTEEGKTQKNQLGEELKKESQINVKGSERESFSFIIPVEGGVTSSTFGDKVDRTSIHKGHDWAVPRGTSVVASEKGVVELAYYSDSYGYNVLIRHGEKLKTRYAHMSKLYVKWGDSVERGQILGLSGNTGDSTGPHLHFEVIKNGIKINPLRIFN